MGKLTSILAEATMLMMVMMMSSAASAANFPIAKPGCKDSCGNISIPFPFGIGEGCSFNQDFLIECNSSNKTGYPTPFLNQKTVISISIAGQLKVLQPVIGVSCYNFSNKSLDTTENPIGVYPFSVSNSNSIFVTGCQNYGLFSSTPEDEGKIYEFGCISTCANGFVLQSTSCSEGQGCCQIKVPSELPYLNFKKFGSLSNVAPISSYLGNCSYAFIAESSSFNDNMINREDSISASSKFPTNLSWFLMSSATCEINLANSSDYACKNNTSCRSVLVGAVSNRTDNQGYRCVCSEGYQGNPYLGCTDINECASPNNTCKHVCVNTPGGYICECPAGYYGDGTYSGIGCIQIRTSNKSTVLLVVGGTSLGISLLLATTFLLYKAIRKRKDTNRRQKFFNKNGGQLLDQLVSNGNNIEKVHIFTAQELNKATDHFNENRVLGRGGQGTVYKGMLSDGNIIAVKKSKLVDAIQVEQFINEVVILSYIDHRNVVKLLGCCLETEVPLLVYEHIPNGTLYDLIHNNEGDEFTLSWEVRIRISKEVARALSYLHSATSIPVYHRDVKSSNILLDEKYRAKVSDFGISRHISIDQTHLTTLVQGTMGYLDPEYFQSSQFTDKSDVYSFGVVLVELLTGRKPISLYRIEDEETRVSSASKFLQSMEDNSLHSILDDCVLRAARKEDIEVVAKLAKRCLSLEGRKRPTMTEVAMVLEGILQVRPSSSLVESNLNADKFGTSKIFELSSYSYGETTALSVDEFPLLSDLL